MLGIPPTLHLSSFRCLSAFAAREVCRHTGPFPFVDGLLLAMLGVVGKYAGRTFQTVSTHLQCAVRVLVSSRDEPADPAP
ncbi:hypothetical protein FHS74_005028 [Nitrospirillum iridis]|uniref:Uncharacterized protein n=1 Tax=Nitrospirillum iridis TaxID=765888 RepID=A0A7X0B596_9PROT|nr:hypothetical protein [Nitrospirillum iridis]